MLVKSLSLTAAASTLLPGAAAFFKMPIKNPVTVERSDPIVSPMTYSAHVHTVAGGSNFHPNATYDDLRASECTSAQAAEDKSNYWVPQLYVEWANGTFTAVPQDGYGLMYYLFRQNDKDKTKLTAFPPGFKMVTGDPTARTYNLKGNMKDAIGWNCLGSPEPTRVEGSGFPKDKYCSGNLRGEIRFPRRGSHVAYSSGESGECPSTHKVRLPTLFYEIQYYVQAIEPFRHLTKNPSQPFLLANGDATGFGWHGDFMNGWPEDLLQKALDTCLSPTSGSIEECEVLELSDVECRRTPLWNEYTTTENLDSLPGCNEITKTAAAAKKQMSQCKEPAPKKLAKTPTAYTGKAPPPGTPVLKGEPTAVISAMGYRYFGCYADGLGSRIFAKQLTTSAKTIAACFSAAKKGGWTYAGLEYG
ncbi:hypothetical protein JCM10213_008153, partial [Rhodosporidiobolus nylandii]